MMLGDEDQIRRIGVDLWNLTRLKDSVVPSKSTNCGTMTIVKTNKHLDKRSPNSKNRDMHNIMVFNIRMELRSIYGYQGATLTSWMVEGQEMLFVSKKSLFNGEKAIRGGVPVVFPQFGPWNDGPQHGFARISKWAIKDEKDIGSESITLELQDTDSTRKLWNHKFRFEYTIALVSEKQLKMDVVITNSGQDAFPFTFLLHTYFAVPDVSHCKINGLTGCSYIDKVKDGKVFTEEREDVTVSDFTDRIYINTPIMQKIKNVSGRRRAVVEKFNLPDTVVWNPWIENAKSMSDFGDDEWKDMLCVEAGVVNTPVVLEPHKSFVAAQILSVD